MSPRNLINSFQKSAVNAEAQMNFYKNSLNSAETGA